MSEFPDPKTYKAKLDALQKKAKTQEAEHKKLILSLKEIKKRAEKLVPKDLSLPGLVKDYQDAVAAGQGITASRPSATKALSAAQAEGNDANKKAARQAISEHVASVEKEVAGDKEKQAAFAKFRSAMVQLNGKLK